MVGNNTRNELTNPTDDYHKTTVRGQVLQITQMHACPRFNLINWCDIITTDTMPGAFNDTDFDKKWKISPFDTKLQSEKN